MTLDEVIAIYDDILLNFDATTESELVTVAEDGLDLVDRRISREGKDAQGSQFPDYTPGYKKKKQKLGRYTGIVNFTLSGQMLRGIQVIQRVRDGNVFKVTVGGVDQQTKDKMEGNNKSRPGWFNISQQEVDILVADSRERLLGGFNARFQ